MVADHGEGFVLISGDLNCVLNNKIDKLPSSSKPQSRMSKSVMNMMKELGLIDAWRHLHPKERDFTFMSQVHGSYSRLDHFLVSKKDTYRVKNCVIEPITTSDHSPVQMILDLGLEPCMKYWRINVSLLTDVKIREEIGSAIMAYFALNDNGMVSPTVLWDAGKATIRGKIISIGSKLKKDRLKKQVEVETEIKRLENEHKRNGKQEVFNKLKENRAKLDEILTYKAEGALRFIDRKYYELGNKASRLLSFQLQKAQASRTICKIKQPHSNDVETSPKAVANTFAKYYEQLYKGQRQELKEEKIHDFLN